MALKRAQTPALIVGCGYLGAAAAARLRQCGREVYATTRSRRRWPVLQDIGVDVRQFDITEPRSDLPVFSMLGEREVDVFVMLTPSALRPALAPGDGYDRLLQTLAGLSLRRAVLVSSTGIYGAADGGTVTAETPIAAGGDDRCRRLQDIEARWRRTGDPFVVCRLAGIYGPQRVIGRRQVLDGEPLPGDADAWLNLIHVDDAGSLLIRIAASPDAAATELGADGRPVRRGDYYRDLAGMLGVAAPGFDPARPSRSGSKRCDPASTWQRLQWSPAWPDHLSGLRACLDIEAADANEE